MKINQSLKDALFGVALGGFMCMCAAIYFNKGENPVISEDTPLQYICCILLEWCLV